MNKQQLRQDIIETLKRDLNGAVEAAQHALDGATHEQSKAETQYDTLGLEHAYLAEGQSRRIDALGLAISQVQNWSIKDFTKEDEIYLGAIVTLEDIKNQQLTTLFLAPAGGGISIKVENLEIKVITPQTPLGESILGLMLDDEVRLQGKVRFHITAVQ